MDIAIQQPQGQGRVLAKFGGLVKGQSATLYRIDANRISEVQRLIGSSEALQSLQLDSGFYMIELDDSSAKFPVPAVAPLATELPVIELQPFPTTEDPWCWVPSGPAVFGDTLGVGREDERPAKVVDVDGFYLARYEVTNLQYAEFLSAVADTETFAAEE